MISSDHETDEDDDRDYRDHGIAREDDIIPHSSHDIDHQAKSGYYEYVDFQMPEESEHVLEEDDITAEEEGEETRVVVAIEEDQCHGWCEDREREEEEEGCEEERSEVEGEGEVEEIPIEQNIEWLPRDDGDEEIDGSDDAGDSR